MVKEELIECSPVRLFEKELNGGLKAGEIGVVMSRKGLGKTSMMVQLGLDQLLQDKSVVHISFSQHIDYTSTWYNDMFNELAKKKNLENAEKIKKAIFSRRVVLNFNQNLIRTVQIISTLRSLVQDGGMNANVIMIDDFNFEAAVPEALEQIQKFAAEKGLSVWYTASADVQTCHIPESIKRYEEKIALILYLEDNGSFINIKALKERNNRNVDTGCKFDVKTMLLAEE